MGMAGLACATALKDAGLRVVILEASCHVGGRIRTIRENELAVAGDLPNSRNTCLRVHEPNAGTQRPLGSGQFGFEAGGEFVHGSTTTLNALLRKERAELTHLFTWAHGDGGPSEEKAPDGSVGLYWVGREKRMMPFDKQDSDHIHLVKVLQELGERSQSDIEADDATKISLEGYLKRMGVSDRAMAFAEAGYANTVCGTLKQISTARMSECERGWEKDGDGDFRVAGTLHGTAIRALERGLDIRRSQPVTKIVRCHKGVEVVSNRAGEASSSFTHSASAVVMTASIPTLQRKVIDFSPPLPESKMRAIDSLRCHSALKMFAKFHEQFWPTDVHGMICSDSFAPEIWFHTCPEEDASTASFGSKAFYLTAFFTSDQAQRIAALKTETAFDSLLEQLSEMFACNARKHYAGGFIFDWGEVPYIWGGYAVPSLNEAPGSRAELATAVDGIFFAGEATDPHNYMTAHAAMCSGERAAREVQHALTKHPISRL
eukprot:gene7280-8669_t